MNFYTFIIKQIRTSLWRKFILLILLISICFFSISQVKVSGYYRKNGTYVQPYYRSAPDGNPYNNYSFPGNTNPYTGKTSTGNSDTYLNNYYNKNKSSSYGNNNYKYNNYYRNYSYKLPINYREVNYSTHIEIENKPFLLTNTGSNKYMISSNKNIPLGYIKIKGGRIKYVYDLYEKKVSGLNYILAK